MVARAWQALAWLACALLVSACAAPMQSQGVSDTAPHHYAVGMKFLETNEPGRAVEAFERAKALRPDHAPAYEGLGLAALMRKDLAKAEAFLKEAKSRERKYVPAYLGLATVYSAKGAHDDARKEADAAIALEPRNARAHLTRGRVLLAAFDFTRAEASFTRTLEIEPASAEARREWDRSVKIRQAAPGTIVGKRIALADPVTRGELAALLATELNVETQLRRKRPELFDASFRPPGAAAAPAAPAPTDISGHWARNAVELVTRLNLMDSYPDRTFRPDEPLTRAQLATILEQVLAVAANDAGMKTRYLGQESPFPDMRSDHFAYNAVLVVTTRGLMESERPSGAFRLTRPVSGPEALLAVRKLAELF